MRRGTSTAPGSERDNIGKDRKVLDDAVLAGRPRRLLRLHTVRTEARKASTPMEK
jgi:hypothetical protein